MIRSPRVPAGLCASCLNHRRIVSGKGSVFMLCELASQDPRFPRYPRLPVLRCAGYQPDPAASEEVGDGDA